MNKETLKKWINVVITVLLAVRAELLPIMLFLAEVLR